MSTTRAAITVLRPRDEIERLWRAQHPDGEPVEFRDAPGDRGTEILLSGDHAKSMDALRRFKQKIETGEVPRSEGTPQGEKAEAKLKQRPAQPLTQDELEEVGV